MAVDWDALVNGPVMGVFGEDAFPNYRPRGGASFDLPDAVFDRAYREVTINAETGSTMNTVSPVLGVRLVHFAAQGVTPAQGDECYVPSIDLTYVVKNYEPDGHGWALLRFSKVKS